MPSFDDLIKKQEKAWNCPGLMSSAKAVSKDKIPFSSPLMNHSTYGGIPRYRISEFYGEPGSGKSTSAIDVCKNAAILFESEFNAQLATYREDESKYSDEIEELEERGPKKILYIDIEHGFDRKWSETIGVDPEKIEIMQPPDVPAEELLQLVEDLISTGEVGLVVLDSIPSLVTKSELEKKYGERTVASLAGLMTVFMRKIVPVLTRYRCTMILINQVRDNLDNPYVANTPGGKAIKFYSSLRMMFRLGQPVDFLGNDLPKNTENPAGYIVDVRLTKQKTAPFDRKNATYYLMCQSGIRPDFDFAILAVTKYGIIKKGGAWFTICDPYTKEPLETPDPLHPDKMKPVKVNGMAKVYDYLAENSEYYSRLQRFIVDDINGTESEPDGETNEAL